MYFYHSKLNFIATLMILALLNACTTEGYYAPVTTNNNESFEDRQIFLTGNQHLNKSNQIATRNLKKRQEALRNNESLPYNISAGIKNPNPEKSITAGRKQQNIATKNITPATNKSNSKARISHEKQPTKLDLAQKQNRPQKKSTSLINDKKMVKLIFGWPIKGKILKSFSPSHNKGIDIAAQQEQSVKATEAGTVVYGGQGLIGFGKLLIIKHNAMYLSAYANNSHLLAKEGQYVKKGQIIAKVGHTGIKLTYLHFEIRKNGKPVNPLNFLPQKRP